MLKRVVLSLVFLLLTSVVTPSSSSEAARTHNWGYIAFHELPSQGDDTVLPLMTLENQKDEGLRFVLSYYVPADKELRQLAPPEPDDVSVRIHYPDGSVNDPKPSIVNGIGVGNSWGMTYPLVYDLPWRGNVLEEAWIELRLDKQRLWLEVPYGFTRNPADPLTPTDARRGEPALAAAMKTLGASDKIVPWRHVHYDLGRIQNGWRLSFNHANPFDAESEIVLYRHDGRVGKSIYLWDLHSPRTAIGIRQPGDRDLQSQCMSIRLHEGGMCRSDSFKFNRNPGDDERCWGTVAIRVDDKTYECVVPSSLFKYVHGAADPHHKDLIPRKRAD